MSKSIRELASEMTEEEFLKYALTHLQCPDEECDTLKTLECNEYTTNEKCEDCWIYALALQGIEFKQPIAVMEQYLPVLQQLQQAELEYKAIDEKRKKFKEQLLEVMEANGITKWENEAFSIAYVPEGKPSVTVDSAKLKKTYPEVYEDCSKPKAGVKAYVKFNVKK